MQVARGPRSEDPTNYLWDSLVSVSSATLARGETGLAACRAGLTLARARHHERAAVECGLFKKDNS